MKTWHLVAGLAAAALLGWSGCRLLRESPETQIRAAFEKLADCLDKRGADEGPLRTVAKRNDFAALLDDTVSFSVRDLGWRGMRTRDEAADRAFAGRQPLWTLRVRFGGAAVTVDPDGRAATAVCDALVSFDSPWGSRDEAREVRVRLVRKDGRWLFSSAEAVPIRRKQAEDPAARGGVRAAFRRVKPA
ncbi:MAG: hypothetical protein IJV65_04020 [Kiritimatiellae bacterium]|nr:hypothetical protein [Kiritimatiellia bacterium]